MICKNSHFLFLVKKLCFYSTYFLFLITSWIFSYSFIFAQETGVAIEPAVIENTVTAGSEYKYTFNVKNKTVEEVTYYLYSSNISDVSEDGVPVYDDNNDNSSYGIAGWIKLSTTTLTVPPGKTKSVTITISVPPDATPGSHYGSVFASVKPPELNSSGAAVGYKVGNIIVLSIDGDIVEQGSIRQFSTDKTFYSSQNVNFSAKIENSGNVAIKPFGLLEIYNMFGKKVSTITFNDTLSMILPSKTRKFHITWKGDTTGLGRYKAIISVSYGKDGVKKTMYRTTYFWILPMNIIGPAILGLSVLLLITFFLVRVYIRNSVQRLSGGRRLVRRKKNNNSYLFLTILSLLVTTVIFLIILLLIFM